MYNLCGLVPPSVHGTGLSKGREYLSNYGCSDDGEYAQVNQWA